MLRKFWLLCAQATTVCLAALFIVATLRPDRLERAAGSSCAKIVSPAASDSPSHIPARVFSWESLKPSKSAQLFNASMDMAGLNRAEYLVV